MIFKQLFDPESWTYTYFVADSESRESIVIDPVVGDIEIYLDLLKTQGCTLKYSLETHVHADHVTGSGELSHRTGALTGVNQHCGASCANMQLQDGEMLAFGKHSIQIIATPGHTPGSTSFLISDRLFTGDSLLINGCSRTDFQAGDAGTLYDSIVNRLFVLPDETLVYPGHDYNGKRVSCIGQERNINPRLAGKSRDDFIEIMNHLNLPKPRLIDMAVPANRLCGILEGVEILPQG